eukprot:gene31718-29512_t
MTPATPIGQDGSSATFPTAASAAGGASAEFGTPAASPGAPPERVEWGCEGKAYPAQDQEQIEGPFRAGLPKVAGLRFSFAPENTYDIDFRAMEQVNTGTGMRRRQRPLDPRIALLVPGQWVRLVPPGKAGKYKGEIKEVFDNGQRGRMPF